MHCVASQEKCDITYKFEPFNKQQVHMYGTEMPKTWVALIMEKLISSDSHKGRYRR